MTTTPAQSIARFKRILTPLLIGGGSLGLLASFKLTLDKMAVLANPSYVPSCDINPVVTCGSVIESAQGAAFGFPNPFLGLAGFAVVVTIGMSLLAGAKYPRWFWLGLQLGVTFGVVFVHWLIWQSLYTIGALCPYCIVVWTVTIPIFWYVTLHNLQAKNITIPAKFSKFISKYHTEILLLWFLVIVSLILKRFWFYWTTLL